MQDNIIFGKNELDNQEIDEYILDLLEILDVKILRLLLKIQNLCIESSNSGFSMNFIQILKLFSNENESYDTKEIQHLKNEYTKMEADLDKNKQTTRFDLLCDKFSLSWMEKQIVIMCLAAELHPKYEKVYGLIADDTSIKYPTLEIVLRILYDDETEIINHKREWVSGGCLQKFLFSDSPWNPYDKNNEMRLDERITYYLLGMKKFSKEFEGYLRIYNSDDMLSPMLIQMELQEKLQSFYTANDLKQRETILFELEGAAGTGKTFQLRHLCKGIGRTLLLVDMKLFLSDKNPDRLVKSILCETILQNAVLAVRMPDTIEDKLIDALIQLKTEYIKEFHNGEIFYVISSDSIKKYLLEQKDMLLHFSLDLPDEQQRKILWEGMSKNYTFNTSVNWGEFASKFKFTPGQIIETLELAKISNSAYQNGHDGIDIKSLTSACYQNGKTHLITKARKIEAKFHWDNIVLPDDAKGLLIDACNQMKFRQTVFGEWGFNNRLSYGKGLSMLFSGPPGTGKTMAAQVVANELQLELYKVNIAKMVSKYIGETEKNLEEIFDEAQLSNAILFFDEADAIFGKRTEVKDSHDRHANVETAYLLQRIEDYEGVTILATNYLKNIDDAFLRRLNFVVEFPFPNATYREEIWRSLLPKETPLQDDISFPWIAEKFEVSGGNIKNIILAAAFLAAEKNQAIGNKHIVKAALTELKKIGKMVILDDLEEYL